MDNYKLFIMKCVWGKHEQFLNLWQSYIGDSTLKFLQLVGKYLLLVSIFEEVLLIMK